MRRLRRTGPSSSRRVRSRARWRSYPEAASVAYYQPINPQSTTYFTYPQSYRRHSSHPLSLVAAVTVLTPSSHSPLHLFRLDRFALIWTILLATFNPIPHLYTFSRDAISFHSVLHLQSHNLSTALYHGTFIISFPHCPLMSCFASLAAVIEEWYWFPN